VGVEKPPEGALLAVAVERRLDPQMGSGMTRLVHHGRVGLELLER
jgi:hypothetical protein